jgi:hypothetical protein
VIPGTHVIRDNETDNGRDEEEENVIIELGWEVLNIFVWQNISSFPAS